jgi:hypothetical protein
MRNLSEQQVLVGNFPLAINGLRLYGGIGGMLKPPYTPNDSERNVSNTDSARLPAEIPIPHKSLRIA